MLTVRGLTVRQPGADRPLLIADRAYLALPWATLWAGGEDLTVRRVELDEPRLDLHALQNWLATRPEGGSARIPTLTDGVQIVGGQLGSGDWSIDRLSISAERLDPAEPFAARLGGRFIAGSTSVPFDLQLALTRPAIDAGAALTGIATVRSPQWSMPLTLKLSGVLRDSDDGIGLDRARLGANATWFNHPSTTKPNLAFATGLAGRMRYSDGRLLIAPLGLALRGRDDMPERVAAAGSLALDDGLVFNLQGEIGDWPSDWPPLPAPLGDSRSPFPFTLDYAGARDFSNEAHLQLSRDDTHFDGYFRAPELVTWLDNLAAGTPLPPLRGTLEAPRLEIAGTTLTGVRLEMDNDDSDAAPQETEPAH